MPSKRHSRPVIVACATSLVMVGAALLVGFLWIGPRNEATEGACRFTHDLRWTFCNPTPSSRIPQPYALRLVTIITPAPTDVRALTYLAYDAGAAPGVEIVSTERAEGPSRDWPWVVSWTGPGHRAPTTSTERLLLPLFPQSPRDRLPLLCWRPELSYRRADTSRVMSSEQLFVFNYPRETRLDQRGRLLTALRAAARGESLDVRNRLESRALDGKILWKMPLDGRYDPASSVVAALDGGAVGLVNFNSGYQVSEALYRELMSPRLSPGEFLSGAACDQVYGSFRGILAVDFEDGEAIWERRLGAIPGREVVCDLDRDGLEEIVLPSYSPANGVSAAGTTDLRCAYTLCLDALGNEVWRYRSCAPYAGMVVAAGDVAGDERLEVVSACGSAQFEDAGCLVVLSHDGEIIAEVSEYGGMKGLVLADLTGDGREEIISGGTGGRLFVFDGNLDVVASCVGSVHRGYESVRLEPLAANDLDGDGRIEVIAISYGWTMHDWKPTMAEGWVEEDPRSYLVILDQRLEEEARVLVPPVEGMRVAVGRGPGRETCVPIDLDGDGRTEILLGAGPHSAYVFEVVPEEG